MSETKTIIGAINEDTQTVVNCFQLFCSGDDEIAYFGHAHKHTKLFTEATYFPRTHHSKI